MSGDLALPALAERINAAHEQAHQAARTVIEHAIECGRLLLEAKAAVAHGDWLPWLEANTSVSARGRSGTCGSPRRRSRANTTPRRI